MEGLEGILLPNKETLLLCLFSQICVCLLQREALES